MFTNVLGAKCACLVNKVYLILSYLHTHAHAHVFYFALFCYKIIQFFVTTWLSARVLTNL
jgi:hypothetical protein